MEKGKQDFVFVFLKQIHSKFLKGVATLLGTKVSKVLQLLAVRVQAVILVGANIDRREGLSFTKLLPSCTAVKICKVLQETSHHVMANSHQP